MENYLDSFGNMTIIGNLRIDCI